MLIKETPWFANMANFKVVRVIPEDLAWLKGRNSCMMQSSSFGMILSCLSLVLIII